MKRTNEKKQKKPLIKRWWIYIIFFVVVIFLPIIINYTYYDKWTFKASEVLIYCGTVFAMIGAMLGVFLSIDYSQKNYHDDLLRRVLPFIAFQTTTMDCPETIEKNLNKDSHTKEKVYLIIDKDGYQISDIISKEQIDKVGYDYSKNDDTKIFNKKTIRLYSGKFINVGVGTAVDCTINVRKTNETAWLPSHVGVSLLPGQKIYMGIYVDGNYIDEECSSYLIKISYMDIYGNSCHREWTVFAYGNSLIGI